MKKIIAVLLTLSVAVFALAACGGKNDVDTVGDMFKLSVPTKAVVSIAQTSGDVLLETQKTLTTGFVGGKNAAVLISETDRLISVEEAGAGDTVVGSIVTDTEVMEYLEGKGVRVDGGKWDSKAESFVSPEGPMSLNLSSELIKNFEYKDNLLRCIVAAENTAEVFGYAEDLPVSVYMEITDDGAVITSVIISYTLPEDADAQVAETDVTIKCFYFYDIQNIEIK